MCIQLSSGCEKLLLCSDAHALKEVEIFLKYSKKEYPKNIQILKRKAYSKSLKEFSLLSLMHEEVA